MHVKVRGEDDIYLQLHLGVWLNQCAETLRWALTAAGCSLSTLYIQVSPNDSSFVSAMGKKTPAPCITAKLTVRIFG